MNPVLKELPVACKEITFVCQERMLPGREAVLTQ